MSMISQKLLKASLPALILFSTDSQAEFFDSRVQKWEFFLTPQYTNSKTLAFDFPGVLPGLDTGPEGVSA